MWTPTKMTKIWRHNRIQIIQSSHQPTQTWKIVAERWTHRRVLRKGIEIWDWANIMSISFRISSICCVTSANFRSNHCPWQTLIIVTSIINAVSLWNVVRNVSICMTYSNTFNIIWIQTRTSKRLHCIVTHCFLMLELDFPQMRSLQQNIRVEACTTESPEITFAENIPMWHLQENVPDAEHHQNAYYGRSWWRT